MKQANKYYWAGAIAATFLIVMLGGNGLLREVLAYGQFGRLPRELRLGCDIGLIAPQQLKARTLDRRITAADFANKLALAMMLVGATESENSKELIKTGILEGQPRDSSITRASTLEILARAAIVLADKKLISFENKEVVDYRDYRVAKKYQSAVSWLQNKYVVRGYPDGTLGRGRRLSLREAIYFIHRFYEAVSSEMMSKKPVKKLSFIDLPLNHPIMKSIDNLTQAGAFDRLILRPSFDGDSFINSSDMTEIINGIFSRANKEVDQIRIKSIFADNTPGSNAVCQRKHLALALEYILDSFSKDRLVAKKINYKDVTIEQPEFESLIKLAGCGLYLGYGNGRFAGNEAVTWYETVRLFDEVLKFAKITNPKKEKPDRLAKKSDIESLKALLRAKKEKIHLILTKKD